MTAPERTPDARTSSEHDCDRILYSDAFRRLGGVTQVVAVGEKPLFHTRLTHTLKVAQLARRMAWNLKRDKRSQDLIHNAGGLDPDAAEAAGLAHDLGHPPFGHIGEAALHGGCLDAALDGYEGNAQSIRILTKLAVRKESSPTGLDISARSLRAVIKYPWMRSGDQVNAKKWNAYRTEKDAFDRAMLEVGPPDGISLEAAIMDWADDITYAVHDLEDFVRAGRVPIHRLLDDAEELATFTSTATARMVQHRRDYDGAAAAAAFHDILKVAFGGVRGYSGTARDLCAMQEASSVLINRYAGHIRIQSGSRPLHISSSLRYEVDMLKQLTWHYVIHDPGLATLQQGHTKIVGDLFELLTKWLEEAEAKSTTYRLPKRLRELYDVTRDEDGADAYSDDQQRRARAAADYISSLTEDQALDLHERLAGVARHSVLDPWMAY